MYAFTEASITEASIVANLGSKITIVIYNFFYKDYNVQHLKPVLERSTRKARLIVASIAMIFSSVFIYSVCWKPSFS